MRLAIIGLGHVAKYQLEAVAHLRQITLVGAHDIKPEQAKILPQTATFYHSIETLLTECDADLILVSTPNLTYFEIGKRVPEYGRSLLISTMRCRYTGCCLPRARLDAGAYRNTAYGGNDATDDMGDGPKAAP